MVIPAFNEEDVIEALIHDWTFQLDRLHINFELHVFNDGSTDHTGEILDEISKDNVRLKVYHQENCGHGPTLIKGYQENLDSEWIFQVDADNDISPKYFSEFWRLRDHQDFIIGNREGRKLSLLRRQMSGIARAMVRWLYGEGIRDVNCPYRLFRTAKFKDLIWSIPMDYFAPNIILAGYACSKPLMILEIPVQNRSKKEKKLNLAGHKALRASMRSFMQILVFRFFQKVSKSP